MLGLGNPPQERLGVSRLRSPLRRRPAYLDLLSKGDNKSGDFKSVCLQDIHISVRVVRIDGQLVNSLEEASLPRVWAGFVRKPSRTR